jgi:putative transposase
MRKSILISCYGFKVLDGILKVPVGHKQYYDIPLNRYVRKILTDSSIKVRSFTLTGCNTVSLCISKEVQTVACTSMEGIDRNLGNLTVGNNDRMVQYDLKKALDIAENTRSIMRSFKRNDVRMRKKLYAKYGNRRKSRINQLLHHVSKTIVKGAKGHKTALAFEKLTHIRKLYQRGNYQGRDYRAKMNGWSFAEIKRQIEYKAAWEGIPVIQLSSSQTRGTSQLCPRCGKRVQEADYGDTIHKRQLWCNQCNKWMNRDVVAAMNIAKKGAQEFVRSKGLAGEAMKGNPDRVPVIHRVDASKLALRREP